MCVPEFSMSPDLLRLNFEHAMVAASTRKADGLNSQIPVVERGAKHKVRKTMTKKPNACHDGITIRIGK